MIRPQTRLLNRLENCVFIDNKDKSVIRIDFDSVLNHLYQFGATVPPKQYETQVLKILDEQVVGKLPADKNAMKILIGRVLYDVSAQMAISEEELLKSKMRLQEDL